MQIMNNILTKSNINNYKAKLIWFDFKYFLSIDVRFDKNFCLRIKTIILIFIHLIQLLL
jgi:hypothetical protein